MSELSEQQREWWEGHSSTWYQTITRRVELPILVPHVAGLTVVDVGCGDGWASRELTRLGARVVACDYSRPFIEKAKAAEGAEQIEYHVIDATNESQLLTLGERRFDGALVDMVVMSLPVLEPLFDSLARMLHPGGWVLLTTIHPCFVSPYDSGEPGVGNHMRARIRSQLAPRLLRLGMAESLVRRAAVAYRRVFGAGRDPSRYLESKKTTSPKAGRYPGKTMFHRALQDILRPSFDAGFVVDGFEELGRPADNFPFRIIVRCRLQA